MIPGQFLQIGSALKQAGITGGSSSSGGGVEASSIIIGLVVLIFVGILAAFGTYMYIQRKKYKYKVVIFERVNGVFQPTKRDKGKIEKISNAGDNVFILRKHKKTLPVPSIQTGQNTYWYYVSDDGEWINIGPADFDQQRRELGAQFLDKEMRFARSELHQMADRKYDQQSFLQKYGGLLASGAMLLLVGIAIYLIMDKVIEAMNQIPKMLEQATNVQEQTQKLVSRLEALKGSGQIVNN
ncbi:MAG: hypothetical protein ABEI74_04825 [Candidatus Pacearchaeota archaeon]